MNKKFIGLFVVLLICVTILTWNTYNKKEILNNNGVTSTAVIEKITTNKFDNDFTPTVDNIHITYAYVINGERIRKIQEIPRNEHDLYFSKTGTVGDSIAITYDPEKPSNSKIEKIVKLSD